MVARMGGRVRNDELAVRLDHDKAVCSFKRFRKVVVICSLDLQGVGEEEGGSVTAWQLRCT